MENKVPQELDWVKGLKECSIAKAFIDLVRGIEHDVKTRNSQGPPNPFEIATYPDSTTVFSKKDSNLRSVVFFLREKSIYVEKHEGGKSRILEAFLTLNDVGECKFKVKGQELESWQVRRLALENLLFD